MDFTLLVEVLGVATVAGVLIGAMGVGGVIVVPVLTQCLAMPPVSAIAASFIAARPGKAPHDQLISEPPSPNSTVRRTGWARQCPSAGTGGPKVMWPSASRRNLAVWL